ncbi:VIER F-box protein 2 [Tanacetum coccineum]|uniref:VIER F-box protein 2 n=1 Tax=Tanacetum coccineum TaxID=301880 RepID=A0ABQ5E3T6_9ASTR
MEAWGTPQDAYQFIRQRPAIRSWTTAAMNLRQELEIQEEVIGKLDLYRTCSESEVDQTGGFYDVGDNSFCRMIEEKLSMISDEKIALEDLLKRANTEFPNDENVVDLHEKYGRLFKETVLPDDLQAHLDDFYNNDGGERYERLRANTLGVTMTKVIKEEFEKLESLKIGDDSFACNTSLEIFYEKFNRISRMDDDLFTYEVEISGLANISCNLNEEADSEQQMTHRSGDDMEYDPSNVEFTEWLASNFYNHKTIDHYTKNALWIYWARGDDEVELTDEESSDSDDEDEVAEIFRIDTNVFDFETPMCRAFKEFNYLLQINPDVLTKNIEGFKTYKDYKDDWIYEWNKDVTWVHERPWTDNGVWEEPTPVRHHCEPFNYKNGCSEWLTCSWKDDGYCNGGNLPGAYIVGNTLRYQDLEWTSLEKKSTKLVKHQSSGILCGAENLAADHLSRLENPYLGVFTEEEIANKFPDEHLMMLKAKPNDDEPWLCPDNIIRRCVAGSKILEILEHCHYGPTGGHHSASITGRKVYESGFFCPSIFKDARDYVMKCDACQMGLGNISSRSEMPQNNIHAFRTAYKTPTGCTPFRLVYGKACHLTVEIKHKAYWVLKQCNMDLAAVAKNHFKELNELMELRDGA